MSKRALLVGINNFVRSDWTLQGCVNDTIEMNQLLTTYFGFQDSDIKVLHDKDATKQGIRDGLAWLLSDYEGGGKDVRVFHFSSHGTQAADQDKEEKDGFDEVIVPYDHDWDKPFRDDDLRAIFDKIPENVNFTFVADCCHSGSIQRALFDGGVEFKPRFLVPPKEVDNAIRALKKEREDDFNQWAAQELAKMLKDVPPDEWGDKIQQYMKELRRRFSENRFGVVRVDRHILLAACQDRETAADAKMGDKWRGAFSWALGRAINEANGHLTYSKLIKLASANLGDYTQHPQLESPTKLRNLQVFAPLA